MSSHEYLESELAIQLSNVHKQYGWGRRAVKVLKGINMDVPYHGIFALLGASGCGKTTLLRCCLGYLQQNSGTITVLGHYPGSRKRGNDVPGREVGYMPQDIGLIPQFSIMETMYFFGMMFNMTFKQIRQRAEFLKNLLELPPLKKRIGEMSGGEQRCVSFAVSLIQEPSLLIMDEPTVGMDSLLRQSVWQYIGELTVAKQCTVVITTHYIDEARRANMVGLMRGGKLLTQSRPEDLIRAYNAVTLEEVFVKLAYKQVENEEGLVLAPTTTVDTSKSIQAEDAEPHVNPRKKMSRLDVFVPRFHWSFHPAIILAITLKATLKTIRNVGSLVFIMMVPTFTAIGLINLVGGDIQEVKLYYYSTDNGTDTSQANYADVFISYLTTSDRFDAEQASSRSESVQKIEDGDASFGVFLPSNFSDALNERYIQRCRAILNHFNGSESVKFPDKQVVHDSTIYVSVDATDAQQLSQGIMTLQDHGQMMLDTVFAQFNAPAYDLNRPPVLLTKAVYGSTDWEYRDYIGSAMLTAIVFLNAIALTAMAFAVERNEGLFERAYSAGASVTDFIFAFTLHASVILMAQVTVLLIVVFAIFQIEMEGSVFLYGLIVWMTGILGAGCGLLLSSQVSDEMGLQNIGQLIGVISIFLCGALWSLNGQPVVLRWISKIFVPPLWPTGAASAIATKGMGLGDEPVYVGYLVALGWIVVIYFITIAAFRTTA